MYTSVIKHNQIQLITLQEAKNYLRIDHDFEDNIISTMIQSATTLLESIIKNCILNRTVKSTFTTSLQDIKYRHNAIQINLPKQPVTDIIEVQINNNPIDPKLFLLNDNILSITIPCLNINTEISIIYNIGMYKLQEEISPELQLACLMLISNIYNSRDNTSLASKITQGIEKLIAPFLNFKLI